MKKKKIPPWNLSPSEKNTNLFAAFPIDCFHKFFFLRVSYHVLHKSKEANISSFFFLINLSKHRDLPNNSFYIIEARNEETGNTLDGLKW